jgi:hypothetical protein
MYERATNKIRERKVHTIGELNQDKVIKTIGKTIVPTQN